MRSRPGTPRNSTDPARRRAGWAASWLVLVLGCSEQDMVIQPKLKPYQPSVFFPDGRSARPLVAGTVARGDLGENPAYSTGKEGDLLVDTIPVKVDRTLLERGQQRFNIYCSPCHSKAGDGRGMIVRRGFPTPPRFDEQRLLDAPVGHFFHVITNGYGAMYSYASRIAVEDRWAIVAYIRALQLSQHASVDDVASQDRPRLEEQEKEKGATR